MTSTNQFLYSERKNVVMNGYYISIFMSLKETSEFIGFFHTGIKEEVPAPNREIAYAISKHYRNKGYTSKAVKGLIQYLFKQTNTEQLNAVVLKRNISSAKILEKNDFKIQVQLEIEDDLYDHYMYHKSDRLRVQ